MYFDLYNLDVNERKIIDTVKITTQLTYLNHV